jgi:hypothetical protein
MKKLSVMLAMLVMVLMAGSVSASTTQLPLVNGDFETAPVAGHYVWTQDIPGWENWSLYSDKITIAEWAPDEGSYSLWFGTPGSNQLAQYTDHVIESGKTYILSADIIGGLGDNCQYLHLVLCAVDSSGGITQLNAVQVPRSEFTDDIGQLGWKTISTSYTADGIHAGETLMIYFVEQGAYGPRIDSIRLGVNTHRLIVSPAPVNAYDNVLIAFENPLSGSNSPTYTVKLDGAPASDVTVEMFSSDEGTILSPSTLTFTNVNWNVPQTVTATVANQINTTPTRTVKIAHATTSSDPVYDELPPVDVGITVYNDDVAGIAINKGDGIVVDEEGQTSDTYTIQLLLPPTETVYVGPTAGDPNAINVSVPVSFTTALWYQTKTITVTAIDDNIMQKGDHYSDITHVVTSADENYEVTVAVPATTTVTIHDNDCGAWGYPYCDINKDCLVDFKDLALFAEDWAKCVVPYGVGCIDLR